MVCKAHLYPLQTPAMWDNSSGAGPANASRCGVDFQAGCCAVAMLYGAAFLLGLATNAATLGPLVRLVRAGNVLAVYLLGLAASDGLYLLTLPLWAAYAWRGHAWELGTAACRAAGFFFYSNMYVSVALLCLISLERCLAVARPLQSRGLRSRAGAAAASATAAATVFVCHAAAPPPPATPPACYDSYPLPPGVARFNYFRVAAGFGLPAAVLGAAYARILRGIGASGSRHKVRARRLALAVLGIFLLCFAPYHGLLLLRTVAASALPLRALCALERRLHLPFALALSLSSFNSALDPVLYALLSRRWGRRHLPGHGGVDGAVATVAR